MEYSMILTTCAQEEEARDLGSRLVEAKLAACVQIHPVTSIYTWQDKVHTDPEFRLIIKTQKGLYDQVEAFINARHSYEVPQIIEVPMGRGSADYLGWMDENTL